MKKDFLELKTLIETEPIIDTHEHLSFVHASDRQNLDLLSFIAIAYVGEDFHSAGMDPAAWFEGGGFEERCDKLAAFIPRVKTTTYYRSMSDAMMELFAMKKELNASNWRAYDRKIREAGVDKGWFEYVFRKKCKIKTVLLDQFWNEGNLEIDYDYFVPVLRINMFVMGTHNEPDMMGCSAFAYAQKNGKTIASFDDYLGVIEWAIIEHKKKGCLALKNALAYERSLYYEDVPEPEARRIFAIPKEKLIPEERGKIQDFIMHHILKLSIKYNLPMQIHTGIQAGNGNMLENSDPIKLNNLFLQYPAARFDVFHAGYPFSSALIVLAKIFPNVYYDLCWMPIISNSAATRILDEALDMIPNNKLFWGGDCMLIEHVYGAVKFARRLLFNVLSARVREGTMDMDAAKDVAVKILWKNASEFYGITM